MIKKIRIKNFKCYGPNGADFNLSKVNFIFGDNSSGKSTFLQFLEMVGAMYDHVGKYDRSDFDGKTFKHGGGAVEALLRVVSDVDGGDERVWKFGLSASRKEYMMVDEMGPLIKKEDLDRVLSVANGADHIVHKEANRESSAAQRDSRVGAFSAIDTLAKLEDTADARSYLNDIFDRLKIPYSCVDQSGVIAPNKIHDKDFDIDLPLHDVGTGIEGLFKLAFTLKDWEGGILALEEPETNVNEKQLANLTAVLIDEAKRATGQMIVECHSELMFLELRNLLAHKRITPDAISISVVQKGKMGSIVSHIPVDEFGNILKPWPGGLFPERVNIVDAYYD